MRTRPDNPLSDTDRLLPELAHCLGAIGDSTFNQTLLELVDSQVGADQVMVFSYRADRVECYLSFNSHPDLNANKLAQEYLESGYRHDPIMARINRQDGRDGIDVFSLAALKGAMTPSYLERFFTCPGIVDKLAILARREGSQLVINLYRFGRHGVFPPETAVSPMLGILGHLVLLHYSDRQPRDTRSPLLSLSERERQICNGILGGKTTDAIAFDLQVAASTVVTYRRRAYAKLGINSKSALFVLCGRDR